MGAMQKLFGEMVKFLETCQTGLLSRKINFNDYCALTGVKFTFLSKTIKTEDTNTMNDTQMLKRFASLQLRHSFITTSARKVVGN